MGFENERKKKETGEEGRQKEKKRGKENREEEIIFIIPSADGV